MPTLKAVRPYFIKTAPPHKGGMHWEYLAKNEMLENSNLGCN